MIDLHCHILPGLDDGPSDLAGSLAFARAAAAAGIRTAVATPHVRDDHPFDLDRIAEGVADLNEALAEAEVDLQVVPGAEVAIPKVAELDDAALAGLCLGDGPYLLVESPYSHALEWVEEGLADVQARGLRPVLAHPERAPSFLADPERLARIVESGVLCSVTAGSMEGMFGRKVRAFTSDLFARELVHNVASDAHDPAHRRPELLEGFGSLESGHPGLRARAAWFTATVPEAILAGRDLPSPAPPTARPRGWLSRVRGRTG